MGRREQAPLRPRVVYERSGRRLVWLMVLLVALGAVLIAYLTGGWYQQQQNLQLRAERDRLLLRVATLEQDLAATREQRVQAQQASRVDREAAELLRQQIGVLQSAKAELETTLSFYQRVLAPEQTAGGVQINQLELEAAAQANWYHYRLVLMQNDKRARVAKGEVELFVGGVEQGESREWPLAQFDPDLAENRQRFSFRYFQMLPASQKLGLIQLPAGVDPLYVRVQLKQQGKRAPVEHRFRWKLKERP